MNKIFFITFVACSVVFSFSAHAQSGKQHRNFDREAFFAKKNAFITAEMGLTPEEAASFIPLCNELQEKMFEAGRECRKLSKDLKHNENATDADYLKVIDECVSVNMRQAQLEKEYYEKFKKILSPKKLYRYKRAEGKFAREFMRGGDDRKEALRLRILDFARFVTDDHVRVPSGQLSFQTPAAFIVHHDDLQAVADHVPDCVRLLCAAAVEDGKRVVECCELTKFLIPHIHDGFRANDQKLQHLVLVIERSRQRDRSNRFAGSHIHEEGASFTCHRDHFLPSAPWQVPCAVACAACPA